MNKLPVFRTAGRAIGFTLYNSFTIFRLAWLPVTAMLAAEAGLGLLLAHSIGEAIHGAPNPLTIGAVFERALPLQIAIIVLQTIAIAAVAVSIHRVILFGDRRAGQYFNFAFGKTEFLYILMGVLTALILLTVLAAVFAPFVFLISSGDPVGLVKKFLDDPESFGPTIQRGIQAGWLTAFFVVYFAAYVLLIYLSLRLAVWPPSVVATNRLSPGEAWSLTRGNVWRFVGAFILTFGWIYIVIAGLAYAYYRQQMSFPPTPPEITAPAAPEATDASKPAPGAPEAATPAPTPSNPPADHSPQSAPVAPSAAPATAPSAPDTAGMKDELSKRDEARKRLDSMFEPYAPLLWVIELFIYIYFTALAVSLMSFSYKALKGYEANEPIPAEE